MRSRLEQVKDWEAVARKATFHVETMAALCSVSPRTLERFFQLRFQQSPKTWARERRGDLALALIKQGWLRKAVAKELSFGNEAHLSHQLRSLFGASSIS